MVVKNSLPMCAEEHQLQAILFMHIHEEIQDHFKHENIQQYNFHHWSCEVLATRRSHGAVCLVAMLPSTLLCMIPLDMALELDRHRSYKDKDEWILGTVECSIHEFYGTRLGQSYGSLKVLYLTEFAVLPAARWCGAGMKLLQVSHWNRIFEKMFFSGKMFITKLSYSFFVTAQCFDDRELI